MNTVGTEDFTLVNYFPSCLPGRCPRRLSLSRSHKSAEGAVYTSCFLFWAVWNGGPRPHVRHNTGPSQRSTKCPIHAAALLQHFFKFYALMWPLKKETQQLRSVYSLLKSMFKFRSSASPDDIGHLPPACTLSNHSSSGKPQLNIPHEDDKNPAEIQQEFSLLEKVEQATQTESSCIEVL